MPFFPPLWQLNPEDRGSMIFWNIGILSQHYMVSTLKTLTQNRSISVGGIWGIHIWHTMYWCVFLIPLLAICWCVGFLFSGWRQPWPSFQMRDGHCGSAILYGLCTSHSLCTVMMVQQRVSAECLYFCFVVGFSAECLCNSLSVEPLLQWCELSYPHKHCQRGCSIHLVYQRLWTVIWFLWSEGITSAEIHRRPFALH